MLLWDAIRYISENPLVTSKRKTEQEALGRRDEPTVLYTPTLEEREVMAKAYYKLLKEFITMLFSLIQHSQYILNKAWLQHTAKIPFGAKQNTIKKLCALWEEKWHAKVAFE